VSAVVDGRPEVVGRISVGASCIPLIGGDDEGALRVDDLRPAPRRALCRRATAVPVRVGVGLPILVERLRGACRVERRGGSTAGVGDACVSMATRSSDDSDVTTLTTSADHKLWLVTMLCGDDDDDDDDDEGASVVLAVGGANDSTDSGELPFGVTAMVMSVDEGCASGHGGDDTVGGDGEDTVVEASAKTSA